MVKVLTWNCNGGFRNKLSIIQSIKPDIAIIQECSADDATFAARNHDFTWARKSNAKDNKKGMAIICFNSNFNLKPPILPQIWSQQLKEDPSRLDLFIPIEVYGPQKFNLLATWSFNNRSLPSSQRRVLEGPILMAIRILNEWLSSSPSIVAGDFNHNPKFDRYTKVNLFRRHIEELEKLKLYSIHHTQNQESYGVEAQPTHLWRYKEPYVIDYIFANNIYWNIITAGKLSFSDLEKNSVRSDHVPIWIDITEN